MAEDLRKVSLSDVRTAIPANPGTEAGMVTLREDGPPYRSLSIVIAQPEARAISAAWTGQLPGRPSTWDLFVSAIGLLDGRVTRAVITAVEDARVFYAQIHLERDAEPKILGARPSDAIALALRSFGAEILVAEEVFVGLGLGAPPVDN